MSNTHPAFEDPRSVLKRHGFVPKRSFGQNFLVSSRVVNRIADEAATTPGLRVLEIGAGVGTLTHALLAREGRVTAIERDRDMCTVLRREFERRDHFTLVEADAKEFDYPAFCNSPAVVTGNLPYQITGPLLRRIMGIQSGLIRAVVMVQDEVADRITARAKEKSRGALSVMIQARFHTKTVLRIAPTAFFPPPKVHSKVVSLRPRDDEFVDPNRSWTHFDRIVKAAFSTRRKALKNALVIGGAGSPHEISRALTATEIDPKLRAEHLTKEDFASIADCLNSI